MAYEKQTWATGDVITEEKLNHIEDGIANAGGVLVVHETEEADIYTLDKTWKEIKDARDAGKLVIILGESTSISEQEYKITYLLMLAVDGSSEDGYSLITITGNLNGTENRMYTAKTENSYPSYIS